MEKNTVKICPLMSTADKKVECTDECAFAKTNPIFRMCAIIQIVEAIDNAANQIRDLAWYIPSNDEE